MTRRARTKPKVKKVEAPTPEIPTPEVDPQFAQALVHAFYYSAFAGCDCEACKALRPFAKKFIESISKNMGGGKRG